MVLELHRNRRSQRERAVLVAGLVGVPGPALCTRDPQEQGKTKQHAVQMRGKACRSAAQHGERHRVGAGARRAGGAACAKGHPVARGRQRRLDASAESLDLAGVGELVREVRGDAAGELVVEEQAETPEE